MAPSRRRPCIHLALFFFLAAGQSATAFKSNETVVYWGRHSDADEGTLRSTCDTGLYTSVIITFYNAFTHHHRHGHLDISGHDVTAVGADIKHCQSKGISILLAVGGQGGDYSLPSSQSAADVADDIWNAFLGGGGVFRPFGDAVVDGVDLFIDQGGADHYDELARRLFSHYKYEMLLTATTRCSFPDRRLAKALATGLFSHIHVRMFGDDVCTSSVRGSWEKWAAAYTGSLVYIGVVASPELDTKAYMSRKALYDSVIRYIEEKPNYGGMVIWDRFYDKKTGFSVGKLV
uniref:GH18 domain-containing protein n=1 Tax=Leersia perrieri TaxID=77586 RepID=A0A0D9XVM9_9ORYZ